MSFRNLLITALVFGLLGGMLFALSQKKLQSTSSATTGFSYAVPTVVVEPTSAPEETVEVGDGYGEKKLIMKTRPNADGTKIYTFLAADENGNNEKLILSRKTSASTSLTVPENTWAPSRQHVLLREETSSGANFLLVKTSGEPFFGEEEWLNVSELFSKRVTDYRLSQATGWNAPNLLIMYTRAIDSDSPGPRYWYDVDSNVFLQVYER